MCFWWLSKTEFIVLITKPKGFPGGLLTPGWPSHSCMAACNPSGRAPALTLAGYAPCDRAPPEMHPHFKQLHGHKIPMNATNLPDRLNLYIFSLNLSYHSFVSVHDIQQKRLLNKLVFTLLLIPEDITVLPMQRFSSRARVMVVPPFDHPWRHQRSCDSHDHHYDAQLIYRIQKFLLPRTMHFS